MQPKKITIIPIWPNTHTRSTQGDRWLFRVSEAVLEGYDAEKELKTGKRGGNVRRKMQLERYNAYKQEIRNWVAKTGFEMPVAYFLIHFYIAAPKSWRKKDRKEKIGTPHMSTPDLDNLLKAFFDSIMPRKNKTKGEKGSDDRKIHCYAAFKTWADPEDSCIKIVEYQESDYMEAFKDIGIT